MMLPFLLEILEGHSAWAGLLCVYAVVYKEVNMVLFACVWVSCGPYGDYWDTVGGVQKKEREREKERKWYDGQH